MSRTSSECLILFTFNLRPMSTGMLYKLQKWVCKIVLPTLMPSLKTLGSLSKCSQSKSFLNLFSISLAYVLLNWLNWFHLLVFMEDPLYVLTGCIIFLSPFLDVIRMSVSTVPFFAKLDFGILYLQNAFLWPMIWMVLSLGMIDRMRLPIFSLSSCWTLCLAVAIHLCMDWIWIKEKSFLILVIAITFHVFFA